MTSKHMGLLVIEKTIFIICTFMLLTQIFCSFREYLEHDFIESHAEEQLYNVDMPMIVLCAESPFTPNLEDRFFLGVDDNETFIGWTEPNISTQDNLRSRATAKNISDLLEVAWVANSTWALTDGSVNLTQFFKPMRITFHDGQCYSLVVPKDGVKMHMKDSNQFIMGLGFRASTNVSVYFLNPYFYNGYFNLPVEIPYNKRGFFQMIDVSLHQIIQSPDDPNVECQSYVATNGYFDCVTEKFEKAFIELITCVPPWFTDDQEKVCKEEDIQEAIFLAKKKQGYVDKMTGKKV